MALFVGGTAQFLAGMWEFAAGNTFGATGTFLFVFVRSFVRVLFCFCVRVSCSILFFSVQPSVTHFKFVRRPTTASCVRTSQSCTFSSTHFLSPEYDPALNSHSPFSARSTRPVPTSRTGAIHRWCCAFQVDIPTWSGKTQRLPNADVFVTHAELAWQFQCQIRDLCISPDLTIGRLLGRTTGSRVRYSFLAFMLFGGL